jgi:hypothetical protein
MEMESTAVKKNMVKERRGHLMKCEITTFGNWREHTAGKRGVSRCSNEKYKKKYLNARMGGFCPVSVRIVVVRMGDGLFIKVRWFGGTAG